MTSLRSLVRYGIPAALALTALPAFAATITAAPSAATVAPGQTFTVALSVDAGSDSLVTVKSVLSYPQAVLEPVSFSLAPSWVALTQSGYDQMSGGTVVKTGGYPSGFTGSKAFGTITFKALAAGTATLSPASSLGYTTAGQLALGGSGVTITVAAPAPKPAPKPAPASAQSAPAASQSEEAAMAATSTASSSAEAVAAATTTASSTAPQLAAAAASGSSGSLWWLWTLIALVVLALIGYWWFRRTKAPANLSKGQ